MNAKQVHSLHKHMPKNNVFFYFFTAGTIHETFQIIASY